MQVAPTDQAFIVTADHVSPTYAADALPVLVRENGNGSGRYFATADNYGCGKDASTPANAISSLFHDNGCTNIRSEAAPLFVAIDPQFGEIHRATSAEECRHHADRLGYTAATVQPLANEVDSTPDTADAATTIYDARDLATKSQAERIERAAPPAKVIKWRKVMTFDAIQYTDGTGDLCHAVYGPMQGHEITGNGSLQAPLSVVFEHAPLDVAVWLVQGEHPEVPGTPITVHATEAGAVAKAVELANLIRTDTLDSWSGRKPKVLTTPATADTWEKLVEWLEDYHGAANTTVWITKREIRL